MSQFPFIGPSYSARSSNFDAQQCINLYPEMGGPNSKNVAMLVGTPGLKLWVSLAGGNVRGLMRFNAGLAIAVVGNTVYRVFVDGTSSVVGTVDVGTNPVGMASNGQVVMIVTGASGYIYDPINLTFTQINNEAFTGADAVWFLDGYFVFNKTGTQQFQITGLYGSDIDGLDFASAEGSPDLPL